MSADQIVLAVFVVIVVLLAAVERVSRP